MAVKLGRATPSRLFDASARLSRQVASPLGLLPFHLAVTRCQNFAPDSTCDFEGRAQHCVATTQIGFEQFQIARILSGIDSLTARDATVVRRQGTCTTTGSPAT